MFLDLNETLIRTGQVEPAVRMTEAQALNRFVDLCDSLSGQFEKLEIVFLTGNSFEYSRRIEEPLGLKNLPGVSVVVVSENGLLARSFSGGDLWRARVSEGYTHLVDLLVEAACDSSNLHGTFYTQGNEIRLTLKPVADQFSAEQITEFEALTDRIGAREHCRLYVHPYYVDVDPIRVVCDGREFDFDGKSFAATRLLQGSEMFNIAVGDSASDIPMFKAVLDAGGQAFWVRNAGNPEAFSEARMLPKTYAEGVNALLESLRPL